MAAELKDSPAFGAVPIQYNSVTPRGAMRRYSFGEAQRRYGSRPEAIDSEAYGMDGVCKDNRAR